MQESDSVQISGRKHFMQCPELSIDAYQMNTIGMHIHCILHLSS